MAPSLIALLLLSLAIQTHPALAELSGCIASFDPDTNYFPDAYSDEPFALPLGQTVVTAANDFTVQYASSYKVVRNAFDETNYVLYQCGAPKPEAADFPAGTRFLEIPFSGFAVDSTVAVHFVQLLGQAARLQSTSEYSVSPCVQSLMASGSLEAFNFSAPFSGPVLSGSTELKPFPENFVSFDTTTDPGALKRAEWIKYMAVFFNAEARASIVFKQISSSYNCLKASVANVTSRPVVGWLSYYGGKWMASSSAFKLEYVSDAGGDSPPKAFLRPYDMAVATDVKAFRTMLETLDVVIDESYLADGPSSYNVSVFARNANLSSTDMSSFKFVATPNLWSLYGRATGPPLFATDWYEGAVAQPQLVLQQLIAILHPNMDTAPPTGFFYNVAKGEAPTVLSAADCTGDPLAAVNLDVPICDVVTPAAPVPGAFAGPVPGNSSYGPAAADAKAAGSAPQLLASSVGFALAAAVVLL